jgi:hypothetical protein
MAAATVLDPFSWLAPGALAAAPAAALPTQQSLELAATVHDVTRGAATVLQIIERAWIDREDTDDADKPVTPVISEQMQGDLMRLTITSLSLLADRAMCAITAANEAAAEHGGDQGSALGGTDTAA